MRHDFIREFTLILQALVSTLSLKYVILYVRSHGEQLLDIANLARSEFARVSAK